MIWWIDKVKELVKFAVIQSHLLDNLPKSHRFLIRMNDYLVTNSENRQQVILNEPYNINWVIAKYT